MPDRRRHRGPHPKDPELFGARALPVLQRASGELAWLLERGYTRMASLKLVGDRHGLVQRQRTALSRATCAPTTARARASQRIAPEALRGRELWIDGLNVLTTLEVALSGGVVLLGSDGSLRDIAGVHGSYRKVEETGPALERVGHVLESWGVARCRWFLDRPVSNSGRLRAAMDALAQRRGYPWDVTLQDDPDRLLCDTAEVVATADSAVLDCGGRWVSLARDVVERCIEAPFLVDLS